MVLVGLLHDRLGTPDVGHQALKRLLHYQGHPDCGSQVEDGVNPGGDVIDQVGVENGTEHELSIWTAGQVFDVLQSSSGEVVKQDYLVTPVKEVIGQV